ncbi:hypothetical protein [Variovorax gossypii]
MSAYELLVETGIDVSDSEGSTVELSEESVRGMDDMLDFAIAERSAK